MDKPKNCAACGRPTQSHNIAIDVSDIDEVGLPTLAGVCCHRCWMGDTEDVPNVGDLYQDAAYDDEHGESAMRDLQHSLDFDQLVAIPVTVEELRS